MDIALLNRKIVLQKNVIVTDDIGNHANSWEDVYACHATISAESPNESTAAGTIIDDTKADFTVRWCDIMSEVTSGTYRVICDGEIYDILGIDHMNFKKRTIKLKCRKVRK